ncbi:MAG: tryptophan synthase subunit alpha [Burkholderiaceae bacterium]
MNPRIAATFGRLRDAGRKALIPYITVGFPVRAVSLDVLRASVAAGADVIELGVPFSDPMADGPTIQDASERALAQGVGLGDVLALVRAFRETDADTPIVLMGYANPIERMGQERFAAEAAAAGVDGVLVVDYPPEESGEFAAALRELGIDPIYLLAPTSTDARIASVARLASGYVYYVSLTGVTGAGHMDVGEVRGGVERLRRATDLPIGVGFGIRDGATARSIAGFADAVIIGTRMIQVLDDGPVEAAAQRAADFIGSVREALDRSETIGEGA